jgi:hypothetical protein
LEVAKGDELELHELGLNERNQQRRIFMPDIDRYRDRLPSVPSSLLR